MLPIDSLFESSEGSHGFPSKDHRCLERQRSGHFASHHAKDAHRVLQPLHVRPQGPGGFHIHFEAAGLVAKILNIYMKHMYNSIYIIDNNNKLIINYLIKEIKIKMKCITSQP